MRTKIICNDYLSDEYIARRKLIAAATRMLNEHDRKLNKTGNITAEKNKLTKKEREERKKYKGIWDEKFYKKRWY